MEIQDCDPAEDACCVRLYLISCLSLKTQTCKIVMTQTCVAAMWRISTTETPEDNAVSKLKLQLVGVIAMYIASKYEEILYRYIGDFSYVTDRACSKVHIHQMETKILKAPDFFWVALSLCTAQEELQRLQKC